MLGPHTHTHTCTHMHIHTEKTTETLLTPANQGSSTGGSCARVCEVNTFSTFQRFQERHKILATTLSSQASSLLSPLSSLLSPLSSLLSPLSSLLWGPPARSSTRPPSSLPSDCALCRDCDFSTVVFFFLFHPRDDHTVTSQWITLTVQRLHMFMSGLNWSSPMVIQQNLTLPMKMQVTVCAYICIKTRLIELAVFRDTKTKWNVINEHYLQFYHITTANEVMFLPPVFGLWARFHRNASKLNKRLWGRKEPIQC